MTSITPPCHVERSRDISAALAAWREPKYLLRRFYEISPRALLGRDDKRRREGRGVRVRKKKGKNNKKARESIDSLAFVSGLLDYQNDD